MTHALRAYSRTVMRGTRPRPVTRYPRDYGNGRTKTLCASDRQSCIAEILLSILHLTAGVFRFASEKMSRATLKISADVWRKLRPYTNESKNSAAWIFNLRKLRFPRARLAES